MSELRSILEPVSPQAARIADLWWLFLIVCALVYVLVVAALLWAALRRRGQDPRDEPDREPGVRRVVVFSTGATVVILFGLLVSSLLTGRGLAELEREDALEVQLVGHQWWWEVRYPDSIPWRRVVTANEIRVPVGRTVRVVTTSRDVIHSFWVPPVQGKLDLIPGRETVTWLRVDSAGVYRGRCAEFCGHQHAKMELELIAQEPDSFAAWLAAERRPAQPPRDSLARRGLTVFLDGACALCHTVRGTPAGGVSGPELTHLASRRRIAAGTLPNTRGHLAAWIVDPQRIKPGARMPANPLAPQDLESLLAYLESLE